MIFTKEVDLFTFVVDFYIMKNIYICGCNKVPFFCFKEEVPFYLLFERGGIILLGKFGRRLVECFYSCPKLCWRLAEV